MYDVNGEASAWSAPATFETGLLQQSDWGSAKWIELAGRTTAQPLPVFARGFTLDKSVRSARLYMSGLGLFDARINGAPLTDEVLAPGYSNYQLSAEYRTYDVTSKLRGGANTIGVELGQGTAHNVKMPNPAAGVNRTNSFAWWNSSAVGNGTLLDAGAPPGDTTSASRSVASYYVGGAINVDTGDGGERFESRTITAIGTAPSSTALAFPAAAGDTNVKVTSVAGLGVGDTLRFDGGGSATVTTVGTARSQTTLFAPVAAGATNVKLASIDRHRRRQHARRRRRDPHGDRGRHAGSRDDARPPPPPRARRTCAWPASPAWSPTARSPSAASPCGSRPSARRARAAPASPWPSRSPRPRPTAPPSATTAPA